MSPPPLRHLPLLAKQQQFPLDPAESMLITLDPGTLDLAGIAQSDLAFVYRTLATEQKSRIIAAALHANHHVVGFLGDGINDGPALKAAACSAISRVSC